MNRHTIGWIAVLALGMGGTALADNRGTGEQQRQEQRGTTTATEQRQQLPEQERIRQQRTFEQRTTSEQQTTETSPARGTEPSKPREASDFPRVPAAGEDVGFEVEQRAASMTVEDRLEAVRLRALENEEASDVQIKLQELGYYKGKIDGKIGPMTRAALQRYFRDQAQLASRGLVSSAVLASFGIDEGVIERVRGLDTEAEEESGTQPSTPRTPRIQSEPQTTPGQEPGTVQPTPEHEHMHEPGTTEPGPRGPGMR